MKNILTYVFVVGVVVASCNSNTSGSGGSTKLIVASDTSNIKFQCPMKCQEDTAYTTFGQCPVCEMDLEKLNDE